MRSRRAQRRGRHPLYPETVRSTEFQRAVTAEFGAFGAVLVRDTVLVEVGNRTAAEALAAGVPAREVWVALCRSQDVPRERWHGAGLAEPPRR